MAETVIDQIVAQLRQSAPRSYPRHGELRNVRVVGHTPKTDHYIYDVVVDFGGTSVRIAAKVYRPSKCGAEGARTMARTETANLGRVFDIFQKKGLHGVPRPVGNFTDMGAVVAEKISGMPLQSIIMKAALLPGYASHGTLGVAARKAGEWLRSFHKVTADMPSSFNPGQVLAELEQLCRNCRSEGLEDASVRTILSGAKSILNRPR